MFSKNILSHKIDLLTAFLENPPGLLFLFILSSLLLIWRLSSMEKKGFDGTTLGSLVMPYCTGLPNLLFVFIMVFSGGKGRTVLENCIVNNVTNLMLIIALPALIWGLPLSAKGKKSKKAVPDKISRLNYLSLLLTFLSLLFFTGVVWVLSWDGKLTKSDGVVLVGLFAFWQLFHIFDILKQNVRQDKKVSKLIIIDLLLIAAAAAGLYISIDHLLIWVSGEKNNIINPANIGWFSGWLMVLPNAIPALYYASKKRADIVFSSQAGDAHICIPLCIGIFALFRPIAIPEFFTLGIYLIAGSATVHLLAISTLRRLPKFAGLILIASYGFFLYS